MNKDIRQSDLRAMVLTTEWKLPTEDPDNCSDYLTAENGDYRFDLKHFKNKGCGCFSGIEIRVESRKDYSDRFTVTVIEAKAFNGYKKFAKWYQATKVRLLEELRQALRAAELRKGENAAAESSMRVPYKGLSIGG